MNFTPLVEATAEAVKNLTRGQLPMIDVKVPPVDVPTLARPFLPRRGAVLILQQARRNFADKLSQTHPHLNRAQRRSFASQVAFA